MKKFIIPLIFFVAVLFIGCSQSSRQENVADKKKISKSLDLYLPEGLEATLWAQSPMLYNPTNMDIDIKVLKNIST